MMSNEEKFWKAREQFYDPPDDDGSEEEEEETEEEEIPDACPKCDGMGQYFDDSVLHTKVGCEKCNGTGADLGYGMFV